MIKLLGQIDRGGGGSSWLPLRWPFSSPHGRCCRGGSITLLAARFWPDRHGGVEQRLWHVSRALAQAGVAVQVLTENRTGAADSQIIEPNLAIRRCEPLDPGWLWRWREWPRIRWWVQGIRRWARPGLIWATDPLMCMATSLAGRAGDLIYNPATCVAAMCHVGRAYPHITSMQRPKRLCWIDRWAYRHARCVVVSSQNIERQLKRFYGHRPGAKIHVVPHGVEWPRSQHDKEQVRQAWDIDPDAFVAGFVGRLDPCKGLELLFEAAAKGGLPRPKDRLLIVGDGLDRARLDALSRRLDLTDQIIWTGSLQDPSRAYAAMDVFVLPSVYEAFGNVLLEAMAHGVPTIGRASDDRTVLTASQEIVDDGLSGMVTDAHRVDDLAMKLRRLAHDPAQQRAMGTRARDIARGRSWAVVAQRYLDLVGEFDPSFRVVNDSCDGYSQTRVA